MIDALNEYMKVPCQYEIPQHGIFLWLDFPGSRMSHRHDALTQQSQVLTIPALAFSPGSTVSKNAIRLSFSYPSHDDIHLGIKKLSEVVAKGFVS